MNKLILSPLLLTLALGLNSCGQPGSGFSNPFTAQITLSATPQALTLLPGTSQHVSVTAQADGRNLPTPSIKVLSSGPVQVTPDSTGVTVAVGSTAVSGTYAVSLTGTTSGGSGQATLNVTVAAPTGTDPTPPTTTPTALALSVTPTALTLAPGEQTRAAITAPAGTTLTLSGQGKLDATIDGAGGLVINVPSDALTGVYVLTVTGTNGSMSGTASLTVTVQKAASGK